jgi:hypothetical protein
MTSKCVSFFRVTAIFLLQSHEGAYWATWTPKGEICSNAYATEHHCLDNALSNLEVEMESVYDFPLPWRKGRD